MTSARERGPVANDIFKTPTYLRCAPRKLGENKIAAQGLVGYVARAVDPYLGRNIARARPPPVRATRRPATICYGPPSCRMDRHEPARRIRQEAALRQDSPAAREGGVASTAPLRDPEAPRVAAPLRLPSRGRRRPQVLGRAEGTLARSCGQAARYGCGRSSG